MTAPTNPPGSPEPVAWVIPGDCNEDVNGYLPARINREGEFTRPLYPESALLAERERADTNGKEWERSAEALIIAVKRAEQAEAARDAAVRELAELKEKLRNPTPEMIEACRGKFATADIIRYATAHLLKD